MILAVISACAFMVLPLFVFDEEIVLPFRVVVQHFAHTYFQLISGKKMGASHPLDVSYTSLLGRALTHWKVQAESLPLRRLVLLIQFAGLPKCGEAHGRST